MIIPATAPNGIGEAGTTAVQPATVVYTVRAVTGVDLRLRPFDRNGLPAICTTTQRRVRLNNLSMTIVVPTLLARSGNCAQRGEFISGDQFKPGFALDDVSERTIEFKPALSQKFWIHQFQYGGQST